MSFPAATEMFQFTAFALPCLCIQQGVPLRVGFPIQKFPDQSSIASSRDLSQAYTSFIACCRQGIRHVRLVT